MPQFTPMFRVDVNGVQRCALCNAVTGSVDTDTDSPLDDHLCPNRAGRQVVRVDGKWFYRLREGEVNPRGKDGSGEEG